MIYEMRTYTLKPGAQPIVARNAGTVARDIRGDEYGKLEGYWLTELGPLNQVVHLWSYPDLNERARLREALGQNERWTNEYLPLILPHLVRQDIRLMHAVLPVKSPLGEGHVYEYRNYRVAPGKARTWAKHFAEAMPIREKYSPNIGAWVTEAGQPNEVSHLWAYNNLEDRMERRAQAAADPDWQAFLKISGPMLEEMHSTILLPAAHSPMQ